MKKIKVSGNKVTSNYHPVVVTLGINGHHTAVWPISDNRVQCISYNMPWPPKPNQPTDYQKTLESFGRSVYHSIIGCGPSMWRTFNR